MDPAVHKKGKVQPLPITYSYENFGLVAVGQIVSMM